MVFVKSRTFGAAYASFACIWLRILKKNNLNLWTYGTYHKNGTVEFRLVDTRSYPQN